MKRSLLTRILLLGLILTVSMMAIATGLVGTEVDWDNGVIRVVGLGAPPEGKPKAIGKVLAQRAARADAYRNATAYIEGVRVDSRTLVKDAVVANDEISNQMSGLIQNGRFIEMTYDMDGICTVVLEIPLGVDEGLSGIFQNTVEKNQPTTVAVEQIAPVKPAPVQEEETPAPVETKAPEEKQPEKNPVSYTSIIVDARGMNIEPALYPQVFDSEGNLLYGATSTTFVQGYPTMVAYARSFDKAHELERAGKNPLVLEAISSIKTDTENPTDVVLDSLNAKVFKQIDAAAKATSRRAIIFII